MWKNEYTDIPCCCCGGTGSVSESKQCGYDSNGYPVHIQDLTTCPDCHGQGYSVRVEQHWEQDVDA